MREIKFRLWNKKEKKWVRDFAIYENGNILCWNDTQEVHSIAPNSEDLIVSQYVGFKDRKGNEIWEGDIVKNDDRDNGADFGAALRRGVFEIKWYPENSCFGFGGAMQITKATAKNLEVIDNIFEQKNVRW